MRTRSLLPAMIVSMVVLGSASIGNAGTFYIDTPDLCSKVERIEGNKVFLTSKGNCPKVTCKAPVTIETDIGEVEIHVNGKFWKKQRLVRFDIDSVSGLNERSEKLAKKITVPKNSFTEEGLRRAGEANALFRSTEYQERLRAEQERLKRQIFGGKIQEYYQGAPEAAAAMSGELPGNERVYIFISSSMPKRTLRNYVRDVAKLGDPNVKLVMRGLVGGVKYISPTLRFTARLLVKDEGCDPGKRKCARYGAGVDIDPLLFTRYGIEKVPAFVYARNVRIADPGMSEGTRENMEVGDYHVLHGDVALDYALDRMRSETGSRPLEALLKKLNRGFNNGGSN